MRCGSPRTEGEKDSSGLSFFESGEESRSLEGALERKNESWEEKGFFFIESISTHCL